MSANVFPDIDVRSYHVFRRDDEAFLFDRATGATLKVDDFTYSVMGRYADKGDSASARETLFGELELEEEDDEADVWSIVTKLHDQGLFRYRPVIQDEQQELMEELWRHAPRRVQLLMAQGCNLGCRYCYAWRNGSNQKGTLMPWEIAKASVDHLVRNSRSRTDLQVTFFGGEPLLNLPTIRRVVEYCRTLEQTSEKRFVFELITNGTLLDKETADWVASEKFLLFISLDGWEEMHNYNRPSMSGENLHQVILNNARYAAKLYSAEGLPAVKVRANLTSKYHDIMAVGDYLVSQDFTNIGIGPIEPLPHGDGSPSALTEDQMELLHEQTLNTMVACVKSLEKGEKIGVFAGKLIQNALRQLQPRLLKGITCGVARNTQVVDNRGNIFPCHRYEGMEAYIIGNVLSGGLDREKTMAYYRKVNGNATNRCHSCWIRDYCAGGCAWLLSAKDGHLADPTERECNRRRKSMESALWMRQRMRAAFPDRFKADGEIDLDSWDWGAANDLNEVTDDDVSKLNTMGASKSSCGSSCETCGPSGCAD